MKKQEVMINGTKLATYESLRGEGAVYVFLHGWGSEAAAMQSLFPVDADYIALDFPGHGASASLQNAWTIHDFAQVTDAYLAKRCAGREVVFVGHSFGCRVAALLAAQENTTYTITECVFVSPLFFPDTSVRNNVIKKVAGVAAKALRAVGLDSIRKMLLKVIGPMIGAGDYADLSSNELRETFKKVISYDLSDELARITVPTRIVWGTKDATVPEDRVTRAADILSCDIIRIDDAGHFPFIDNPTPVKEVLYVST